MKLLDRPTGELLVIMIGSTICGAVVFTGTAVAVAKIFNPTVNVDAIVSQLSDIINTLIGLLAGFLAGRTDYAMTQRDRDARLDSQKTDTGI